MANKGKKKSATTPDTAPEVHLYVLLDRSGSMASMAADVIGGFNRLLADQQADGADARMTLVQFDSEDAQEVIADAVPIAEMVSLDHTTFVPRGATPLLDATGVLLGRASERAAARKAKGKVPEQIVVVSITDGHENASREYSLATVQQLIAAHTAAGWSFVFLGAAVDVYGEAGGLGYDQRSVQSFAPDGTGADMAFSSLSLATSRRRQAIRAEELYEPADFFEGDKPAEVDRSQRHGN